MRSKIVAVSTLIAAGAGYVVGILTAPKSGKNTRKDIADGANKAQIEAEKQLKKLHSELQDLILDGEKQSKKAKVRAKKELDAVIKNAKVAKQKSREILSALHQGDAQDPNLKLAIRDVQLAKKNLAKYLKKK